ncbi:MAG: TetR/AcrR family transcriptional regulator [Planctomycetes bacterium]|nr:TetR/AcrR family transcriptional regulator [Planctomycetota bacterium]
MARPPKARVPLKQAALELFVEQGVHATGIRDIAKHAGCSEAALYRHWKNKDDLVVSLFTEHLAEVRTILEDAIASATDLDGKVHAAIKACYKLYDEHPRVFRFILLVQHELSRTLPNDLRMPQDVVHDLAKDAIKRGEAKGDAMVLAAAVIGIFVETAIFVLYGRLAGPLSRYAGPVAESALRVLRR